MFRDWLRAHPDDAAAYEELKRGLAAAHPNDTLSYTDAKTAFITGIVDEATAETARTSVRHGTGGLD